MTIWDTDEFRPFSHGYSHWFSHITWLITIDASNQLESQKPGSGHSLQTRSPQRPGGGFVAVIYKESQQQSRNTRQAWQSLIFTTVYRYLASNTSQWDRTMLSSVEFSKGLVEKLYSTHKGIFASRGLGVENFSILRFNSWEIFWVILGQILGKILVDQVLPVGFITCAANERRFTSWHRSPMRSQYWDDQWWTSPRLVHPLLAHKNGSYQ